MKRQPYSLDKDDFEQDFQDIDIDLDIDENVRPMNFSGGNGQHGTYL